MEPAKIDWANMEWVFSMDDLYEHINAPKWVDFSAPDASIDDEAWFCRPDCNHPKTVEDFLSPTPPSKVQRSPGVCENLPLGDRNKRDANLKRRGILQPLPLSSKDKKCERFVEDGENQNPNFSSTPSYQYNSMKAAIKSSAEKKKLIDVPNEETMPRLKSTLSARNLFGGGQNVLNQITEFCNELKKLATRAKDRENAEKSSAKKSSPVALKEREKERKPLLEVTKDEDEAVEKSSNVKQKLRRKKRDEFGDDAENIPLTVDVKSIVKSKERENIRTNPPSPQCFSARKVPGKATPLKASRCKPPEKGILQEKNADLTMNEGAENINLGKITPVNAEKEARTLDVFWFLKPCTLAS